jgi:hypothetical protein
MIVFLFRLPGPARERTRDLLVFHSLSATAAHLAKDGLVCTYLQRRKSIEMSNGGKYINLAENYDKRRLVDFEVVFMTKNSSDFDRQQSRFCIVLI